MTYKALLIVTVILSICFLALSTSLAQGDTAFGTVDTNETESAPVRGSVTAPALVHTLTIEGAIGAVTDERIEEAVQEAEDDGSELLIILLNTPGGFTRSTWSICESILNSEVPVCVYVSPMGARATSAGVYITYSAHIAAMAPASNIGAAHPVTAGGDEPDSVMYEKMTNDAVAQIRSAAEKHGRNVEWAEKAVRESVSITSRDALDMNVIDFVADDLEDLLKQLDGREVILPGETRKLALSNFIVEEIESTFAQRLRQIITSPDVVLILFSIGSLGIVLELYHPGAIFPGVIGAISLILAFYASQTLPINYAGVALILLSIILFLAEVKIVSHGLLTIGGVISFFLGGLMLVDTVDPALKVSLSLLITISIMIGLIVSVIIFLVVKAARHKPFTGDKGMIGKTAEVRRGGMVYVNGALWKAKCDQELNEGATVEILAVEDLILTVKKIQS